jgi:hypothetical protein
MRSPVVGTEYLVAGCHGKLSFWPEYLDVNVALPVSRAFRNWIRDGRQAAGMGADVQDGRVPLETSRLRFVYGPSGMSELLAGVIRPSADIPKRTRSCAASGARADPGCLDDIWDSLAAVATSPPSERFSRVVPGRRRRPLGEGATPARARPRRGSSTAPTEPASMRCGPTYRRCSRR